MTLELTTLGLASTLSHTKRHLRVSAATLPKDALHLHGKPKMESKQVLVDVKKSDGLSKVPPETDIKAGEIVRVVQAADHLGEDVFQQVARRTAKSTDVGPKS